MGGNLGGWTGLIVIVLIILLFGAPKLPGLARSIGQSMKIFKSEVRSDSADKDAESATSPEADDQDSAKK